MLIERRRLLHERTGEAIEALFKDRIDDHLAELAHHYSHSANTLKAVKYLSRAGSQAVARSAYSEAVTRLSSALEFLKHLPDDAERARQELSLLSVLGSSLLHAKGWAAAELEPVYARARELCAQIRDPALAFRPLWYNGYSAAGSVELDKALELADELLAAAKDVKDPAMFMAGNFARGVILTSLASWFLRMSTWRRRWRFSTSGSLFPRSWRLQRSGSLPTGFFVPVRTWLSRSCLGEIARDAGGGSAVFRPFCFGSGFLLCGLTSTWYVGTARPRRSALKRRWRSPKSWGS